MPTVIGSNTVVVGTGNGFRADGTAYSEVVFEGTAGGLANRYFQNAALNFQGGGNLGYELNYQRMPGKSQLVIRTPDHFAAQGSATMRLIANEVQKSLLEPPFPPAFEGISSETIEIIRKAIKNGDPPEGVSLTGAALDLYELLLRGTDTRLVSQPVLHVTQNVSSVIGLNLAFTNVDEIVTNALIAATTPLPTLFVFNLPLSGASDFAGYTYGWLKKYPTVEWSGENRYLVSNTFEFGLWDDRLYVFAV